MKKRFGLFALLAAMTLSSCTIEVKFGEYSTASDSGVGTTSETESTVTEETTTGDETTIEDSSTGGATTGDESSQEDSSSTGTTGADSSTVSIVKHGLSVDVSPNIYYYQYDHLDLSDMIITEYLIEDGTVIYNNEIDDYTMTWEHNSEAVDLEARLMTMGEFNIVISKEDCTSCTLPISVESCTSFNQTLQLTLPTKRNYHVDDKLDLTGMSVQLITKKTAYSKSDANYSEYLDLEDLNITVGSTKYEGEYTCTTAGSVRVTITYQGYEQELSTFFNINISSSDYSPVTYKDDTITWEEDSRSMTVSITNTTKSNEDKGYYSPEEVVIESDMNWYGKHCATGKVPSPTKGKTPFLIVPVVFPGEEAQMTQDHWDLIHKAFFGNSDELYFESLHSYYYKSSFGQLDITGNVTDYFEISGYDGLPTDVEDYTEDHIAVIANKAWAWAQETYGITPTDYDSNSDGFLDGMWMVRMCDSVDSATSLKWAFNTASNNDADISSPTVNNYGWIPFPFMDDSLQGSYYQSQFVNRECDAHVCIHETGHMFGLADYYSYSYSGYSPLGGFDMMDKNYGDHNPYSKMLYNWITPYVVTGNCEITIPSCQNKDAVIVIPYDDKTFKTNEEGKIIFNPFDEYLVLDLYNCLNLYEQGYDVYEQDPLTGYGGRLYHVDNRLMTWNGSKLTLSSNPDGAATTSQRYGVFMGISNSEAGDRTETNYDTSLDDSANYWDELRMITANKKKLSDSETPTSSSLFKSGNSFSLSSYSGQFNNSALDCGKALSYVVNFTTVK